MNAGAIESAKPTEILQNGERRFVSVLPWNALLERPYSDAKDDCKQIGVCESFGAFSEESFARAFLYRPVSNPLRTHFTFLRFGFRSNRPPSCG
jgi:hypothetical protein